MAEQCDPPRLAKPSEIVEVDLNRQDGVCGITQASLADRPKDLVQVGAGS